MSGRLAVELSVVDGPLAALTLTNVGDGVVHIFDSPDLPYLLRRSDRSFRLLQGINPPPDDVDLFGFDVLLTRPLPPGDAVTVSRSLDPFILADHYGRDARPTTVGGPVGLDAVAGWLDEPVVDADRHLWSLERLLAAQHVVGAPERLVDIGPRGS